MVPNLQLLTCSEVAQILRMSVETVRQLASAGKLPGRKIGRGWRFPQEAIKSYVFETPNQMPPEFTAPEANHAG